MFDLLKLHDSSDRTTQSWIFASGNCLCDILNENLAGKKTNEIINILKKYDLASYRNKSKTLLYMEKILESIKNGERVDWLPLFLFSVFPKNSRKICHEIRRFNVGLVNTTEIKATKELDISLSKLMGIFAADGSISNYDGQIWIKDKNRDNLIHIRGLFKRIFNFEPKIIKLKNTNAYGLYVNNKIIQRYFTNIFGFQKGYKTNSIDMPKIIRKSSMEIKRAFASGVLSADGSVLLDGVISMNSKSRNLIESVSEMLKEDGLKISAIKKSIHRKKHIWYFKSCAPASMKTKEKIKWLNYFHGNREKQFRVLENVHGIFNGKPKNRADAQEKLMTAYCKSNNSKTTITNIMRIGERLSKFDMKDMANNSGIGISMADKYINILLRANVFTVKRKHRTIGVGKGSLPCVYGFNDNISDWKVPTRDYDPNILTDKMRVG